METTSSRATLLAATSSHSRRLHSLDAFRGATMLLMASSGMGIAQLTASRYPDSPFWKWLAHQCGHSIWVGCTLWDLIQPSFMFMVGVAIPYSLAKRQSQGAGVVRLMSHALLRSMTLVLLAVFLTSTWSESTQWVFTNVLAQIGLGYPFVFALAYARPTWQFIAALVILAGYWMFFAMYVPTEAELASAQAALPSHWNRLSGFAAHWDIHTNAAAWFDRWFLNIFPRDQPYEFSSGGYQTLNFIPSIATMVFGLLAGELLRSERSYPSKVKWLMGSGLAGVAAGLLLQMSGLCPMAKPIWTPSWTLFSTGWVCWLLAVFVVLVDGRGPKVASCWWPYPLIVAGMNPITLYCLWHNLGGFINRSLQIHLGANIFHLMGDDFVPVVERLSVLLVLWLIVAWMHRQRIYVRI